MMAIGTGLIFSLNSISMRVIINKLHFSPLQLNNDAGLIQATWLCVLFFEYTKEGGVYSTWDIIEAASGSVISMMGAVALGKAISIGLGGPVQAIANLMSLVQTLLGVVILSQIPTILQSFGIMFGLFGAFVISGGDRLFFKSEINEKDLDRSIIEEDSSCEETEEKEKL